MFFKQSDEALIDQALNGSERGWHKLVKRYEKAVYGYAYRMTGNQADAMDLMQETFISVCNSLHQFKGNSSFKTWLMSLAHYRCIDFYRRKQLDKDSDKNIDHIVSVESWSEPSENHEAQQSRAEIIKLLSFLPFDQKLVVELKMFQQLTFDQIAEQLGCSVNTVKSQFYSALSKLKRNIESKENAA